MDQYGDIVKEIPTTFGGDACDRDCTSRCRSQTQACDLVAAMIRGDTNQIQSYCKYTCSNFGVLIDHFGRTLLHIASSCGKTELVSWLLQNCQASVDAKDKESGWTALHRGLFYGQLAAARILLTHKASLKVVDHEGLTPLGIVMKDRLPYVEYRTSDPSEVYCWGSNSNYNLGTGNDLSRETPELLEAFRRVNVSISKVILCKFHTAFLSNDGQLFTCGHGLGGRLGQTLEATVLAPKLVKGLGGSRTTYVAAGQHHLVILTDGGQVWTCGTNTYHQLGHLPPPESLLVPRPVSLKLLKGHTMIGCAAAKFHSVIFTKDAVFTFGLNAGQLGHPKGDRTQILPRQVAALNNKDTKLTHVEASDGATVCATDKGDVFVLHEFQCRKIASKQLELKKICVVGGRLDSKCDVVGIREDGAHELKVLLLTRSGKLFLWREEHPVLVRCLFAQTLQPILVDVCLNYYSVAFVTNEGAGYDGRFLQNKTQEKKPESSSSAIKTPTANGLVPLLNRDECELLRVKRIPYLHRASTIFCDNKGRNYAVIQSHPKTHLTELPFVSTSTMENDLKRLYDEVSLNDTIHDVVIKVGKTNYPAHKFILASRCDYFQKQLTKKGTSENVTQLNMEFTKPEIFKYVLQYIYCNTCDYLVEGKVLPNIKSTKEDKNSESKKRKKGGPQGGAKSSEHISIIHSVIELSKKLGIKPLAERLQRVSVFENKVTAKGDVTLPNMTYDSSKFTNFCDVNLRASDGVEFSCHRCILVSRMDYFHSMLNCGWIESGSTNQISLPIHSRVMTALIDYLYTDSGALLYDSEDVDFMCQTLTMSDQYLIPRLKEMSEVALVDMITLKNVCELLELSYIFNASQLKKTCLQYICINISALLELECLEILNDQAMTDLTDTYRQMVPGMDKRYITPYSCGPTIDELENIAKLYPVAPDQEFHVTDKEERPKRRRTHSRRISEKETEDIAKNEEETLTESSEKPKQVPTPPTPSPKATVVTTPVSVKPKTPFTPSGGWGHPASPKEASDVPSLSEIMQAESQRASLTLTTPPSSKKKSGLSQKQKKLLAKSTDVTSKTITPSLSDWIPNDITTPTSPRENPWNIPKAPIESPIFSLNDPIPEMSKIIKEELEEEELIRNDTRTKSLALIKIEEEAMSELLAHYELIYYPDELISVSRILPAKMATPHWRKT